MVKYEYKVVTDDEHSINRVLAEYGKLGWHLVCVDRNHEKSINGIEKITLYLEKILDND